MNTALRQDSPTATGQRQFATFYLGDLLFGIDIANVQEINRQGNITPVPHADAHVRGVINLRGEVATVIDLRSVLGMAAAEDTPSARNLIVHSQGEAIGLWVDRISDILTLRDDEISRPPANVDGIDGKFFHGVHTLEQDIVVILDIEQVLADRS